MVLPPSAERGEEEAADLGVGVRFLPALPYEAYIYYCVYMYYVLYTGIFSAHGMGIFSAHSSLTPELR